MSSLSTMQSPGSCRFDNSLGLLTRKFVSLLKESDEGILDLNYAATQLEVQKRRIYDITNVLEGIGLIEKKSKNNVRWRGIPGADEHGNDHVQMQQLRDEISQLKHEEAMLDRHTNHVQNMLRSMSEDEECKRLAYLSHLDIRNIACFSEDTLLAVKAPYGSTLEVPDPDEGMPPGRRRYEIQLSSKSGAIDVFLIQDPQSATENAANSDNSNSNVAGNETLLKHFDVPPDPYDFELKPNEGPSDLYGFNDVFNVFNLTDDSV